MLASGPGTDIISSKSAIVSHAHAHGPAPVGKVPSNDLHNHEGKGENESQNELLLYLRGFKAYSTNSLHVWVKRTTLGGNKHIPGCLSELLSVLQRGRRSYDLSSLQHISGSGKLMHVAIGKAARCSHT